MFDLFSRAFIHPIDYAGVVRTTTLTLLEHRIEESGVHTFIFRPAWHPHYRAGQHALFTLPGRNVTGKSWRAFSIASAPHEEVIQIGTNIPDSASDFKTKLRNLQVGETIKMHGPFGEFYLRPSFKRIIGIAGGIGITPFRSLIADATERKDQTHITIIYSARERHTYQAELDRWAQENPNLTLIYSHVPEEVTTALRTLITAHGNSAHYFISGAPAMIQAMANTCQEKGIDAKHIHNDPFKGY